MVVYDLIQNLEPEMGHAYLINVGKCKGHFDRRVPEGCIQLMVDISAWFLQKREVHRLRIPSEMAI